MIILKIKQNTTDALSDIVSGDITGMVIQDFILGNLLTYDIKNTIFIKI